MISAERCRSQVDSLAQKLGAGLVIINTPRDECLRRLNKRKYPARGRQTWAKLANEWHDNFEIREADKLISWKGEDGYRPLVRGQPLARGRFGVESAEIRRLRTTEPYLSRRKKFLADNPLCRPCATNGFTVGAEEIDHIVPVLESGGPEFLDASNWQPICRPCHARKTATETRRRFMTPEQAGWQERLMETASRRIAQ